MKLPEKQRNDERAETFLKSLGHGKSMIEIEREEEGGEEMKLPEKHVKRIRNVYCSEFDRTCHCEGLDYCPKTEKEAGK